MPWRVPCISYPLRSIDKAVPAELDVHCIVDNYSSHKHPKIKAWLPARPRWHMHFIPNYGSCLNSNAFSRSSLTRPSVVAHSGRSRSSFKRSITSSLINQNCKPVNWTATANSILAKLNRLCERISGTGH
ncbi:transposase [Cupriavidus necator N-1]|uniref:Transposase n=1 Tax=Cupriavidus necator (strain ATCC 43291 / DSM 13513 / CCUG 52238 / LMG 8453 / N-1) TaxID=1042878 RepID=G0ETV2_CUPNN|nr:transposase [Cupriavidus necator N-1]